MNKLAHFAGGAVASAAGYYFGCKILGLEPTWPRALAFAGIGAGIGCLPDLLEPALHPWHRSLFHSVALNAGLAYGVRQLWRNPAVRAETKVALTALSVAYISHPLLDATTPRGLPLVG